VVAGGMVGMSIPKSDRYSQPLPSSRVNTRARVISRDFIFDFFITGFIVAYRYGQDNFYLGTDVSSFPLSGKITN